MCRLNNKEERGFTLVELLLTLVVLTVFLSLVLMPLNDVFKKVQVDQFFAIFEADVFHTQANVLNTVHTNRVIFDSGFYSVVGDGGKRIYVREIPPFITIANRDFRIQFNINGTIIQPRTYRIYVEDDTYAIVFPLGKGRYYVEKVN